MCSPTLTFRRVDENRRVRGTTSSYWHCSSTCERKILNWNTLSFVTLHRNCLKNVGFSALDLLCFPQYFLQKDEEVVGISFHKFLQTPAVYAQPSYSQTDRNTQPEPTRVFLLLGFILMTGSKHATSKKHMFTTNIQKGDWCQQNDHTTFPCCHKFWMRLSCSYLKNELAQHDTPTCCLSLLILCVTTFNSHLSL